MRLSRTVQKVSPKPEVTPQENPPWHRTDPRLAPVEVVGGLRWDAIPAFPRAAWETDVGWRYLQSTLDLLNTYGNLDLNPDFQRGHVWTEAQRRAWVEYVLQGGETGRNITFVTDNWRTGAEAGFIAILDGKQRLESVERFMRGDLRVFPDALMPDGYAVNEIGGVFREILSMLRVRVVEVTSRAEALKLYLSFNGGGRPHAQAELDRVRALLAAEQAKGTL